MKWVNMILTALVLCAVTGASASAKTERVSALATLKCPGNVILQKGLLCEPGHKVVATGVCPNGQIVRSTIMCPTPPEKEVVTVGPDQELIRYIAGEEITKRFRWGFGLGGNYFGASNPGPAMAVVEGEVFGGLRLTDNLYFHFAFAPGKGWVHGDNPWTLSEFAGLAYQLSEQFSLVGGVRHRVAFVQDEENINALMGEAQLRVRMSGPLFLSIKGALGSSWYPYMEDESGFWPAGVKIPQVRKAGNGLSASIGAGLELEF